ncbi:MAG: hypothetical protein QGG40_15535, partial [Myxococcota bacterium]|nr:hypothetical protein [Myxococcota bacterium]
MRIPSPLVRVCWSSALFAGLVACQGEPAVDTGGEPPTGPTLTHEAPDLELSEEDEVELQVSASDEDGVYLVVVYTRTQGGGYWDSTDMSASGDDWAATIEELSSPGLEYYFKATDASEAGTIAYLPEEGAANPYTLEVWVQTSPLPFEESFEGTGEEESLLELDWWTPSEGFSAYAWEWTSEGHDSDACVSHA